jgi:hypothetical protein
MEPDLARIKNFQIAGVVENGLGRSRQAATEKNKPECSFHIIVIAASWSHRFVSR